MGPREGVHSSPDPTVLLTAGFHRQPPTQDLTSGSSCCRKQSLGSDSTHSRRHAHTTGRIATAQCTGGVLIQEPDPHPHTSFHHLVSAARPCSMSCGAHSGVHRANHHPIWFPLPTSTVKRLAITRPDRLQSLLNSFGWQTPLECRRCMTCIAQQHQSPGRADWTSLPSHGQRSGPTRVSSCEDTYATVPALSAWPSRHAAIANLVTYYVAFCCILNSRTSSINRSFLIPHVGFLTP